MKRHLNDLMLSAIGFGIFLVCLPFLSDVFDKTFEVGEYDPKVVAQRKIEIMALQGAFDKTYDRELYHRAQVEAKMAEAKIAECKACH